jgi:tRNA-Thr(GGU) m(6)t(6)A37 methyltransferase TsaA
VAAGSSVRLDAIGWVSSALTDIRSAPKQGDEGGAEAWLVFDEAVGPALANVSAGDSMVLITWLHEADRSVLRVHPRDDRSRPEAGVFSTRSPDRPNPIGLHDVVVLEVEGRRVRVRALEAVDGTPILDLKPKLAPRGRPR